MRGSCSHNEQEKQLFLSLRIRLWLLLLLPVYGAIARTAHVGGEVLSKSSSIQWEIKPIKDRVVIRFFLMPLRALQVNGSLSLRKLILLIEWPTYRSSSRCFPPRRRRYSHNVVQCKGGYPAWSGLVLSDLP